MTRSSTRAPRPTRNRSAAVPNRSPDIDDPATYANPTGELHSLAPSAPERRKQLAAQQEQGDLPNELVRKAPPTLGTDPVVDPAELAHGPGPAPPVAISLNADD